MTRHCLLLPALGLCALLSSAHAVGYDEREPIDLTAALAANGTVVIKNVNGDIEVRTWDRNEIHIEGEKRAKTPEDLARIETKIDFQPNRAEYTIHLPRKKSGWFGLGSGTLDARVTLIVTVPATADLEEIRTVNGNLEIRDIGGRLRGSTVNGSIRAENLAGDVHLNSVNGRIRADLAVLPRGADLRFETVNGGITVALPRDANAELSSSVVNGSIESELPITVSGSIGRKRLNGTLGDGGAHLGASTVNGSIRIVTRDS